MARAMEIHEQLTGAKPLGWYSGRDSPILATAAGMGPLPPTVTPTPTTYHTGTLWGDRLHLIIPYTLDINDMRFSAQV